MHTCAQSAAMAERQCPDASVLCLLSPCAQVQAKYKVRPTGLLSMHTMGLGLCPVEPCGARSHTGLSLHWEPALLDARLQIQLNTYTGDCHTRGYLLKAFSTNVPSAEKVRVEGSRMIDA